MLSKKSNKIFAALSKIKTKRRIALTGSPFQNNLLEYFQMVSWARAGVLGVSEMAFDKEYVDPITKGLASDASLLERRMSDEASKMLHSVLIPYVQRRDASVLRQELKPMQQVVSLSLDDVPLLRKIHPLLTKPLSTVQILHIRQTKMQARLYQAYKRYKTRKRITNFIESYQHTRPINNHPAALVMSTKADNTEGKTRKSPTQMNCVNETRDDGNGKENSLIDVVELSSVSESGDDAEDPKLLEAGDDVSVEGKQSASSDVETMAASAGRLGGPDGLDQVTSREGADNDGNKAGTGPGLPPAGRAKIGEYEEGQEEEWWRQTAERQGGIETFERG